MEKLHFARGNLARRVPVDPTSLDRLIHASFVGEIRADRVPPDIKEAARSDLEKVSRFEGISLNEFVPQGSPFFANAGHNGYTWEGSRRTYAVEADVAGEVLMSPAFIGSSSNVYVPMLQVGRRTGKFAKTPDFLPRLMIYDREHFVEARYDIRTAQFVATENGQLVTPETLRLLNSPQQKSDYVKDSEAMEVPEHFKIEGYYVGGEFFPSSFTHALKHVGRAIAFFGMDLGRFHDQLQYHFSLRGRMLRKITHGDKWHGWISQEQIGLFSHASYEELADTVRMLKRDEFAFDGKLNRFLLYKAFEQNEGSFLIGQMQGDGHTIHLPYVPVEIRRE